jgi:hypothetical protein
MYASLILVVEFPDYMPSKMRLSDCSGKTSRRLGRAQRMPMRRRAGEPAPGGQAAGSFEHGSRRACFCCSIGRSSARAFEAAAAMIVLIGIALYGAVGMAIAGAFVVSGITRVLPEPAAVTIGARVLIFPGAAALWPYVLFRWLKSCR